MNRASPTHPRALFALAATVVLALGVLGVLWHRSRHARWETPHWSSERFVAIRVPDGPRAVARRVVAVNPSCSQCAVSLAGAAERRRRDGGHERIVALVVDTPRMPPADVVAPALADEVWWDAAGVWRRRWGHRIYGETLRFDAAGAHRGTWAPGAEPESPP